MRLKHESYLLDGLPIVKRGRILIDERLHDAIELELFVMQSPKQADKSREQIERLKKAIDEHGAHRLPPLIVEDMRDYMHVLDGKHRALALWESGITHHAAIFVRRKD